MVYLFLFYADLIKQCLNSVILHKIYKNEVIRYYKFNRRLFMVKQDYFYISLFIFIIENFVKCNKLIDICNKLA